MQFFNSMSLIELVNVRRGVISINSGATLFFSAAFTSDQARARERRQGRRVEEHRVTRPGELVLGIYKSSGPYIGYQTTPP